MMRRIARFGLAGALLLASAGCLKFFSHPKKPHASALWVGSASDPVATDELAHLESLGTKELFVETARIEWQGTRPRFVSKLPAAPTKRVPTTLVVAGSWPTSAIDKKEVAEELYDEVQTLRLDAERAGYLAVGIHFDVDATGALAAYGETLGKLKDELENSLFVSATLDRRTLADANAHRIADGVDFLVCFLYGQREGEREDPSAWDLQSVEANVRKLEGLGRSYLLGAVTVGTMAHRATDGRELERTTEADLAELVRNDRLELKPGFSLEGVDREVFEFRALHPTPAAAFKLGAGESVRIVRTATAYIEEFLRRAGAWESPSRLGELFYRPPGARERLSLTVANLVDALEPGAASPDLDLTLSLKMRAKDRWIVTVVLANRSAEPSELAFLDANYVELKVAGATIGDVEPGDFRRYELLIDGEKRTIRALRTPNQVRLFRPLVEAGDRIASGDIELRLHDPKPSIVVSGTFLLPDGRTWAPEPREWSFEEPAK